MNKEKDEVIEFINRRFSKYDLYDCFCNHNCYFFAKILCDRFTYLHLYYDPIDGHFLAGNNDNYYDFTGKVTDKENKFMLFAYLKEIEPLWFERIVRDCIE